MVIIGLKVVENVNFSYKFHFLKFNNLLNKLSQYKVNMQDQLTYCDQCAAAVYCCSSNAPTLAMATCICSLEIYFDTICVIFGIWKYENSTNTCRNCLRLLTDIGLYIWCLYAIYYLYTSNYIYMCINLLYISTHFNISKAFLYTHQFFSFR